MHGGGAMLCAPWLLWTLWSSAAYSTAAVLYGTSVVDRSESDRVVQRLRPQKILSTSIDNDKGVVDYNMVYLDPHVKQRGNDTLDEVALQVARQFSGPIVSFIALSLLVWPCAASFQRQTTTTTTTSASFMENHRAGILRIEPVRADTI
jgi:hypothetical protein